MNLPTITTKQQVILELLYRYRFLDRMQIQTLMGHTDKRRVISWVKDLRDKQYVEWVYSNDFEKKTKPAIYYLGINGVRYLRSTGKYPLTELRKRYKESYRSEGFISRSIFLADISIELGRKSSESKRYVCQTAADYVQPGSEFHFVTKLKSVHPGIVYARQQDDTSKAYLLELLDATLPRERVKRRLKFYADLLDYGKDWAEASGGLQRPTVLFVCPSVGELLFAKRRTRKLLENAPDRKNIHIKFKTVDKVRETGVISGGWEEA